MLRKNAGQRGQHEPGPPPLHSTGLVPMASEDVLTRDVPQNKLCRAAVEQLTSHGPKWAASLCTVAHRQLWGVKTPRAQKTAHVCFRMCIEMYIWDVHGPAH